MKILFITEFFPDSKQIFTGGVEARTFFTAQALRRRHQVKIISRRSFQVPATFLSIIGRSLFMVKSITQGLSYRPDIVEGSNVVCYLPAWLVARFKRAKAVAWVPDILGPNWRFFGFTGWLGRFLEWLSFKLPWDHYLALSHQTKAKLLALGIKPKKITVVYPGINQQEFKLKVTKRRLPTLCLIARLVPYKHADHALTLLHQLKPDLPQLRLLIIGTGPQKKLLHHQIKSLNLTNQVYFKANLPRQELIKQLKSCHLLIHFSTVEGFGLVLLEALAAGIPYLAYDTPINQEVTRSGQGGVLVTDISTAATTIKQLLRDKSLYRQKVAQGKQLLADYSWQKSAQETEKVLKLVYGL